MNDDRSSDLWKEMFAALTTEAEQWEDRDKTSQIFLTDLADAATTVAGVSNIKVLLNDSRDNEKLHHSYLLLEEELRQLHCPNDLPLTFSDGHTEPRCNECNLPWPCRTVLLCSTLSCPECELVYGLHTPDCHLPEDADGWRANR